VLRLRGVTRTPTLPDTSSSSRETKRAYGGPAPFGVPLLEADIAYAAEMLKDLLLANHPNSNAAVRTLLEYNERVVSRCGTLMSFSGVIMALMLYIATNPAFFSHKWQVYTYYTVAFLWFLVMIRLLYSLAHRMPPPWAFSNEEDFVFTARLYLRRMSLYNFALITSISCFIVMGALLLPFSAVFVDSVFHQK
jgi:hypothetical protein